MINATKDAENLEESVYTSNRSNSTPSRQSSKSSKDSFFESMPRIIDSTF